MYVNVWMCVCVCRIQSLTLGARPGNSERSFVVFVDGGWKTTGQCVVKVQVRVLRYMYVIA